MRERKHFSKSVQETPRWLAVQIVFATFRSFIGRITIRKLPDFDESIQVSGSQQTGAAKAQPFHVAKNIPDSKREKMRVFMEDPFPLWKKLKKSPQPE